VNLWRSSALDQDTRCSRNASAVADARAARRWNVVCACLLLLVPILAFAEKSQAAPRTSYALGPGDEVSIQVFGEPELSQRMKIAVNGRMTYPFLGELAAAGMTTSELEKRIADGLRGDFLVDPNVSVTITEYRPFFVNGQVKAPGSFPFQPGLTVRKAVSLAGGLTERASEKRVSVISEDEKQQGRSRGRPVRMDDMVEPGDIITVDESFF
jgi:protein involved in polysaccharide export with SLBB domain